MSTKLRKFVITVTSATIGGFFGSSILYAEEADQVHLTDYNSPDNSLPILPKRADQLKRLQRGDEFDVLIIGGGATGVGCALDAVTRGLKTALVEGDDFASRTSSKSTKLIHGGIRYLEKAVWKLDREQYHIVKEALSERSIMLEIAPHLTQMLPIMIPIYSWGQIPYYWFGLKLYDLIAGRKNLKKSHFLSKHEAIEVFPLLETNNLAGAICYFDGQQDDSRMCLTIAVTAARYGATVCNYLEVIKLFKRQDSTGHTFLCGARVKDTLTGKEFNIKTKCIINATGPYTDEIRKLDDPKCKNICSPSSGVHIVLPSYICPTKMAFVIPSTSDGRMLFCIRWQHHTLAGTTDLPCKISKNPKPTETEIIFIIKELKKYLNVEIRRSDVLSAWSGIRPLVFDPSKDSNKNTPSLSRNHVIIVSPTNLVTISGGKWTTYRAMAMQTVDEAVKCCNLKPKTECITKFIKLDGAANWSPKLHVKLVQDFGVDLEVAKHLARAYGDRAFNVIKMAGLTGKRWPIIGNRLHPDFPYIDAEVRYGIREYACTAIDIIARRTRLAFLNAHAAEESLIQVIDIMSEELNWTAEEKEKEHKRALDFLSDEMGLSYHNQYKAKIDTSLTKSEINTFTERFKYIDKDNRGYITVNDICNSFQEFGDSNLSCELLEIMIGQINTAVHGQIQLNEYLEMMAAIKSNLAVDHKLTSLMEQSKEYELLKKGVSIERSGGGL